MGIEIIKFNQCVVKLYILETVQVSTVASPSVFKEPPSSLKPNSLVFHWCLLSATEIRKNYSEK